VNRAADLRERFVKDETGFTLAEMMVTIVIMMIVFFALYNIFDMTFRVFSFGNNEVEATESARIGMEKMEREIRQAYRYNDPSQTYLFFDTVTPTNALTLPDPDLDTGQKIAHELTFGNELGSPGDGQITCASPSSCEYITYKLTNADGTVPCSGATCTLWRANGSKSGPVIDNVVPNGLSFTFLTSDNATPADESQVDIVLVELDVVVDRGIGKDGVQELTSVIDLRNRQ
jgi:Tfp pilus assembly protein PilW